MADTTLLLNGFSIIGDPQTNSNASNGGQLMIHNGTAVFDGDDIIVFHVEGATVDGVLTDDSVIVGVTVYDRAFDYFNDIPKYEYTALPGGGADIDVGRNTMGDRYLEFDASSLTSTDPDAPVLGQLAVVSGIDILGTLNTTSGPFVVPTIENIDLDGDGIISGGEISDGRFSKDLNILAENLIVCFAAGTLIETATGPQAVETLRCGDMVNTLDDGPQPIRWIGGTTVSGVGANAPVLIRRGAIGNLRDLFVSQNHRILVTGAAAELLFGESQVLVAAKHLVNDHTIRIVPCDTVSYWHFLCDSHQIVFAEATPVESLYPGQQSLKAVTPVERDEIIALFPDLGAQDCDYDMSRYTLKRFEAEALRRMA
ncbi:MAG: Hint domain-containing protein [Roseovarius sp.]|nr:Hint domain-containing protein [Roseovarius sp.]